MEMTLDRAIKLTDADEMMEVTSTAVCVRKWALAANQLPVWNLPGVVTVGAQNRSSRALCDHQPGS
jgi:hypothetical protein